jgi:putative membrane protein
MAAGVCCEGGQLKSGSHLDSGTAEMLDSPDMAFVMRCAQENSSSTRRAKLEASHTANPEIKALSQQLMDDSHRANARLVTLARDRHVILPNFPASKDVRPPYNKRKDLSNAALDKIYLLKTLRVEQAQVKQFKKEAKSGKDREIREFAAQTLPQLQSIVDKVKLIRAKVTGGSSI